MTSCQVGPPILSDIQALYRIEEVSPEYKARAREIAELVLLLRSSSPMLSTAGKIAIEQNVRKLSDLGVLSRPIATGSKKYTGHPFWSDDAWRIFSTRNHKNHVGSRFAGLRHEHVVPVAEIARLIVKEGGDSSDEIARALVALTPVIIITKWEDDELERTRMPEGWVREWVFGRYERVEFCQTIRDRRTGKA